MLLRLHAAFIVFACCLAHAAADEQFAFFEKRIRPLLVNHCYSCHSSEAKKVKGELYLDSRAGLRKGGASGPAVVAGRPEESLLIQAVRYDTDLRMPPKSKLSATEIADLEAWVKMGTPDPRTENPASAGRKSVDFEAGRKHWSFQPLSAALPPAVNDRSWPSGPIDQFILRELEKRGLRPVENTDKRTLIRRATCDLTGLPPTPDEIEAFLQDDSPHAFAVVVERLLASPHYGERWGRHWLDVVRYADTAGDNSDYPIPQMYRYRNWVIDAFNRDMPFDHFIREQLAGDLTSPLSHLGKGEGLIATGYLANARRFGSYEDARYPWHLTIEDTIDNLGKAFLGLTINCCRCHDHKFDPLSSEDYYGLYGFFSSTRYPWSGIELDKVPKDLVPLASPVELEKATQAREQRLADADAMLKRLEEMKAGAEAIQAAKKERDRIAKTALPIELAYAVIDGRNEAKKRIGQVGNARLHMKGDPDRLGKEVPRHFPTVLGGHVLSPDAKGSGRMELANWIADSANPLTARVLVNRIWQHHFGRGIVATPNDFGKQGRPPTHPELLDYLAHRFISSGWSVKEMHRLIMLSRVYQLASRDDETNLHADVNNDYLWRFSRQRLDAESIRDAILAISGSLERTPGRPHPFPEQSTWNFTQHKPFKAVYDSNQRSVYLMTQRIQRHPFLALFDGADTNASTAVRTTTTTPLQALFLMNDPFVHEQARKFAARLLADEADDSKRIERAFVLAFGRPPSAAERCTALTYLAELDQKMRGLPRDTARARGWESLARALIMSNEFVYVN